MPFAFASHVRAWFQKFYLRRRRLFEALDEYERRKTSQKSRGSFFGDVPPARVEGTRALEQTAFDRFRAVLGDVRLSSVTQRHCEEFRARLRSRWGAKAQTIGRTERPLRVFFSWCVEQGYLEISPFARLKNLSPEQKRETDMLTVKELENLLKAAEPWLRDLMYLMGVTGARRAQACFLRWRDYEPGKSALVFRSYKGYRTKSGRPQIFPLNAELAKFLDELHAKAHAANCGTPDDLIFTGRHGKHVRPDKLSKAISRLMKQVGTRDVGAAAHAFRRTASSRWAEAGASSAANAWLLGHSPKSGTRVVDECYVRVDPERARDVVSRAGAGLTASHTAKSSSASSPKSSSAYESG